MSDSKDFETEKAAAIAAMSADDELKALVQRFYIAQGRHKYTYHWTWMGRPIIQFPQDIVAMQEIVWKTKPSVIVETGIAHGGSLVFYASLLELLGGDGRVIGVDIDIRAHNRVEIERHPMARRIDLIEGSSTSPTTAERVRSLVGGRGPVLLVLDSNHTHAHVLEELRLYSGLVNEGSYIVVFDTLIEDMPHDFFPNRPWGKGNSPKSAVWEFLKENKRFEIDKEFESKLLITVAPDGYLRCVRD